MLIAIWIHSCAYW